MWVVWQRGTTEVGQVETDPIGPLLPCLEEIWGEWCIYVASEFIDRFPQPNRDAVNQDYARFQRSTPRLTEHTEQRHLMAPV